MASVFNILRRSLLVSFAVFPVLLPAVNPAFAELNEPFDHSTWNRFLDKFVDESGRVDYAGAKQDPSLLQAYLSKISLIDTDDFKTWPREERIALLLNAYHAGLVSLVLEHYPISSTQDVTGFWDVPAISMVLKGKIESKSGKNTLSLNEIRQQELISVFHDEKIHLALSLAANSGPHFPKEAFTGPRVEGQLFLIARNFVNDPDANRINVGDKKIYLSRIFKWYESDFHFDFGDPDNIDHDKYTPNERAILSFIAYYINDAAKIRYLEDRHYKIDYLPFDWSLNDAHPVSAKK